VVRVPGLQHHQQVRQNHLRSADAVVRRRAGDGEDAVHASRQLHHHARFGRVARPAGAHKEIAHASGRFQVACYKEEIEASLRTASFSGYELLDLHDYLGRVAR